jgi:hypothetical protein
LFGLLSREESRSDTLIAFRISCGQENKMQFSIFRLLLVAALVAAAASAEERQQCTQRILTYDREHCGGFGGCYITVAVPCPTEKPRPPKIQSSILPDKAIEQSVLADSVGGAAGEAAASVPTPTTEVSVESAPPTVVSGHVRGEVIESAPNL